MEKSKIGVIGSGQMGAGIAQVAAMSGFSCLVTDSRSDALTKAGVIVGKSLEKFHAKGKVKDVHEVFERIQWHNDIDRLATCDLIIEAVTENDSVKKEVLRRVDSLAKEGAIVASNTSSISITHLSNFFSKPENFIGMHFMNPVPLMQLVEIVKGHHTSDETISEVTRIAEAMGKTTTVVNDYPGFVSNRVLMPMINEAFYALMEGVASAKDIDTTMRCGCNFPMGPLALADLIGLDTCLAILEVLYTGFSDSKYRPCPLLKRYVDAGLLGRKTKEGVYRYEDKG